MTWNWQQSDWPEFEYDDSALAALEEAFLLHSGELLGAFRHIVAEDQDALRIELISEEALKTSKIQEVWYPLREPKREMLAAKRV